MLQKSINIHEAKTHLSRLLQFVAEGNEVIICKFNEPLARLMPVKLIEPKKRKAGLLAGKITIADDFDEMPVWFTDNFR